MKWSDRRTVCAEETPPKKNKNKNKNRNNDNNNWYRSTNCRWMSILNIGTVAATVLGKWRRLPCLILSYLGLLITVFGLLLTGIPAKAWIPSATYKMVSQIAVASHFHTLQPCSGRNGNLANVDATILPSNSNSVVVEEFSSSSSSRSVWTCPSPSYPKSSNCPLAGNRSLLQYGPVFWNGDIKSLLRRRISQ